jgi:hypothetical protein
VQVGNGYNYLKVIFEDEDYKIKDHSVNLICLLRYFSSLCTSLFSTTLC